MHQVINCKGKAWEGLVGSIINTRFRVRGIINQGTYGTIMVVKDLVREGKEYVLKI